MSGGPQPELETPTLIPLPEVNARGKEWRAALPVALEGAGFALPIAVGAIALLFARVGPALVAPGLLAALLGLVLVHLAGARHGRPMVYTVRVLEVSMVLGFLDQFIAKMPGWGLADTPEHRLMLVMAVIIGATLLLPLGHALRLQRFARMIPMPVFAGFSTAVATLLLISQSALMLRSWQSDGLWFAAVALGILLAALAVQRWLPKLPPGVMGLGVGAALALLLGITGVHTLGMVMDHGLVLALPVFMVSWPDAWAEGVHTASMARDVVLASATLAVLAFINAVVNEEAISQLDDAQARPRDWMRTFPAYLVAALAGSPLITPSLGPSRAATRVGRLGWRSQCLVAALMLAVLGSGVLRLTPLAAICGLLLFDAWIGFDRRTLRLGWLWLRGRKPALSEKEDLVTTTLVVVMTLLFTIVIGVAIGVIAGLILYAWRNGQRLARTVESGTVVRSNCARSRADAGLLAQHAQRVGFVALEGALFFGAAKGLQALLREQCTAGRYVVIDWSHVVSADSTVANAFSRAVADAVAAGARVAVSGLEAAGQQVGDTLRAAGIQADVFPDADRGLEWAEDEVIRSASPVKTLEATNVQEAMALLRGVAAEPRAALEALLQQRFFRAGEVVFAAGQVDSELMLILQGGVDILVAHSAGRDVRLARLRRGAMLGELSFLDTAARAASAVASEDLLLGVLSRERFDAFAKQWPEAGQRVLTNLALDLAFRLRRTNHIAVSSLR